MNKDRLTLEDFKNKNAMDGLRQEMVDLICEKFSEVSPSVVLQSVLQVAIIVSNTVIREHNEEGNKCNCEPLKMAHKSIETFGSWLKPSSMDKK